MSMTHCLRPLATADFLERRAEAAAEDDMTLPLEAA
jgi:hypothetical protein